MLPRSHPSVRSPELKRQRPDGNTSSLHLEQPTVEKKKLTDILRGDSAVEKLKATWNTTEAAAEFAPVPPGEYILRILSGELSTSRGGTPGYKLTLEVAAGEHEGRRLWHDLWLTPAALPMAKRDLEKIGIKTLEQLEQPIPPRILI